LSRCLDETSAFTTAVRLVSLAKAGDLRGRAARYRRLADTVWDPRVIAVLQACAHELEVEASSIEDLDLGAP
jgi:hypothetical protein